MILAGDIGGTTTRLALFERPSREPQALERYWSAHYGSLEQIVEVFLADRRVDVSQACFAVAGPVRGGRVDPTNLAWRVDARELAAVLGLPSVGVVNDLEANAHGIALLEPEDLVTLNEGVPEAGNRAVIAAGTGLGEAGLYWDGARHRPFACEGGHTDFAPRNELESGLLSFLAAEHPHVSYERVCSGMGLVNIYRYLIRSGSLQEPEWYRAATEKAATISQAALDGQDEVARRALDAMISIYGAEAGNLALKLMAVGGVYVGGGIAPKILPRLRDGAFMAAFVDKGRLSEILVRIPVRVVLTDKTALYGAAIHAAGPEPEQP